jgi:hypothetical protein
MAEPTRKPASRANTRLSNLVLEGGRSQSYKSGRLAGRKSKSDQAEAPRPAVSKLRLQVEKQG